MKKTFIFLFFAILLSMSIVSGVEISVKDSFKKGENFIAKVSGNFINPLTEENVVFYRRHLPTTIIFELEEMAGDYYIFSSIPSEKVPDNYSISLEGISYRLAGEQHSDDVSKEFIISNESAPLSVSPPISFATYQYDLHFENLMLGSIEIDVGRDEKTVEQIVSTGESVSSGGFLDALFGLLSGEEISQEVEELEEDTLSQKIYLSPGESRTVTFTAPAERGFEMLNFYYENEAYGALVYNSEGRSEEIIEEVEESNQTVVSPENQTEENESDLNDTINEPAEEEVIPEPTEEEVATCAALNGSVCKPKVQKCDGKTDYAEVRCCLGTCVDIEEKGNNGKVIGWAIIIALALFVTWFVKKKYKGAGPGKINLFNIAKGKK